MCDKEKLEGIKRDLMERWRQSKKTAEGMHKFGDCGISFEGITTIYEKILLDHFGEKCSQCKERKILVTKELCENCLLLKQSKERFMAGLQP